MPVITRPLDVRLARLLTCLVCMLTAIVSGCAKPATPPVVAKVELKEATPEPATTPELTAEPDAAGEQPAETSSPPPRSERLIVLTPRGPLVVRLEISIEGVSQFVVVEQTLDEAVRAGGGKGDEDPTWAALMDNPRSASGQLGNLPINNAADRQRLTKQFDLNHDGRAQRSELTAFLAQDNASGRAFSVRSGGEATSGYKQDSPLFVLFDEDQDGQLSAAEMAVAAARLSSRDADDDDVVVLANFRQATSPAMNRRAGRRRDHGFELRKSETDSIYYALCDLYDSGSGLDAGALSLTPSLFVHLDADGNGRVSQRESEALVDAPAALSLKVNFAPADDSRQPTIELMSMSDDLVAAGATVRAGAGQLTVTLAGFDLDLLVFDQAPATGTLAGSAARFAALDTDKNGWLEAEELKAPGLDLKDLDENDDGKLSLKEVQHAAARQRTYGSLQVQVEVSAADDPLFAWLDANHDDRLTAREISGATARLAQLDANGDAAVSAAEIPDSMTCTLMRGAVGRDANQRAPSRTRQMPDAKVPAWLTAMDVNRDGELSLREFLGTSEQFTKMDTNSDGVLDASEAQPTPEATP